MNTKVLVVAMATAVTLFVYSREHGGINDLTPSEMFLQRLIKFDT